MKNKNTNMDDIDSIIFDELGKNARITSDELSQKTNISSSTIRRRLKRLIDENIINIVAIADVSKMGYTMVGISLEIDIKETQNTVRELTTYTEIQTVAITSGKYNVSAVGAFTDIAAFQEFMKKVFGNLKGVISLEVVVYLEIIKGRFMQGI